MLKRVIRKMLPERAQEWIEWHRTLGDLLSSGRQLGRHIFDDIQAEIDTEHLIALQQESRSALDADPEAAAKYYDHRTWLRQSVKQAVRLNLHQDRGLKVLDIGCGPAWFLAVANHLGHECTGMDLPLEMLRPEDRPAYSTIPQILHCADQINRGTIKAFQPIHIDDSFDLITCFLVCFDGHWQEKPWGVNEWEYFLNDANRLLTPGGRLYLELNPKPAVHPELKFYDRPTRELFLSKGSLDNQSFLMSRA
jgi:SAM-dependent methyltransferase